MIRLSPFSFTPLLLVSVLAFACSKPPAPVAPDAEATASKAELAEPDDVHIDGDHLMIDSHINFAFDSDEILDDSAALLDHIALLLSLHPEILQVEVVGHTDAAGGHDHNQELSERRAAAVVAELANRNVAQAMSSRGVGELEPVCSEDTDECHASNRRVEFIIALQ